MRLFKNHDPFYKFEGFLTTQPIISFMEKNGKKIFGNVVDIGCGEKPYQPYFNNINLYVGLDINKRKNFIGYDSIGDIQRLPFKNDSFDAAICTQVIEHIPEPRNVLSEIWRVLKNKGVLILTAPQMGRLHGEPYDYYRYTKWGLKYLLESEGFEIIELIPQGHFFRAIGSHINFFVFLNFAKGILIKKIIQILFILPSNFIFGSLDRLIKWDLDTLGYNIIAIKKQDLLYNKKCNRANSNL